MTCLGVQYSKNDRFAFILQTESDMGPIYHPPAY